MRKPVICLDVDGVVCDFISFWKQCAVAADVYLVPEIGNERAWDLECRYMLTGKQLDAINSVLFKTPPAYMAPIEGAIAGVQKLRSQYDVFFATSSLVENKLWESGRRAWFKRHFDEELASKLCFTAKKQYMRADIFVDDKLQNIQDWIELGPNLREQAVLFNTEMKESDGCVTSWKRLPEVIKERLKCL